MDRKSLSSPTARFLVAYPLVVGAGAAVALLAPWYEMASLPPWQADASTRVTANGNFIGGVLGTVLFTAAVVVTVWGCSRVTRSGLIAGVVLASSIAPGMVLLAAMVAAGWWGGLLWLLPAGMAVVSLIEAVLSIRERHVPGPGQQGWAQA
ncbi:hypothetical protein [Salininema proteolyticum]|uniref:Uncharacterized protein n=1 Tax=Salininema proteolyticum TaxID=1607685 RepID=A0ABV8U5H8_9ACTN